MKIEKMRIESLKENERSPDRLVSFISRMNSRKRFLHVSDVLNFNRLWVCA